MHQQMNSFIYLAPKYQPMLLSIHDWSLPVRNPVFLFGMLMLTILVAPALLQRYKIPGIIGFILTGALLGPHGINLLEHGEGIKLLAAVGLLYLMFWAGLEIDMANFLKIRYKSLAFGLLTFCLPLVIGGLGSYYLLDFDGKSALLLASMFSTHTLISYPIVNRLRLTQNEAVTIAVGGTIITDTLALLLLAVISGSEQGTIDTWYWIRLAVSLGAFSLVIFTILPKISKWFFRKVESDLTNQYVFVLAVVFTCGLLAELTGVEAIIGAFLAGLMLNRLIPHTSLLMGRIEFVGNALFIPAFLFSVGMMVNLNIFFKSAATIVMAVLLTFLALITKWLAAFTTQKIYGYSVNQRNLIFGLSSSHAAATIAIILIGYQLNLFDEAVLNSAVFLILVTCLVSSVVTDKVARKMAPETSADQSLEAAKPQRILVPFSNPDTVMHLVDFSILLKTPGQKEPVYPLSIIYDEENAREKIMESQRLIEPLIQHAQTLNLTLAPVHRVDVSAVSGIRRAAHEILATDIVIGWRPKISATEKLFGTLHDNLLEETPEMIFVAHFTRSPLQFKRVKLVIAPNGQHEPGFTLLIKRVENICQKLHSSLSLLSVPETAAAARPLLSPQLPIEYFTLPFDEEQWFQLHENSRSDELLIIAGARREAVSYDPRMEKISGYLTEHFMNQCFVMAFPAL